MKSKNWIYLLILFMLVDLSKAILAYTHYHLVSWDESVFLGMGKFIFSLGHAGLWEVIRPIGLPFILGMAWKLGLDYLMAAEVIMELFTFGSLAMIYLIGKKLYDEKIGFLAALMTFLTPAFFGISLRIMTGIPSLFFCLLGLYLLIEKRYVWSGIACFIAFMTRYPSGLMFIALAIILLYEHSKGHKIRLLEKRWWLKQFRNRPLILFSASFSSLLVLFLITNWLAYGSFLEPLLLASEHQSTFAGNVYGIGYFTYYSTAILSNLALMFAIFALGKRKDMQRYHMFIPLAFFILYFTIIPHKKERFAVLFIPYLAMLASYGFYVSLQNNKTRMYKILGYSALVLMLMGAAVNCLSTYSQFPKEEPGFVGSYLEYFKDDESLTILTSDPIPAAFSDALFIPYYHDPEKGNEAFDSNIAKADFIIYMPSSFPWNDSLSLQKIFLLTGKIRENDLEYEEECWGQKIEIYKVG